MKNKTILGIILVPTLILLVPLVAIQITDEVNWDVRDFIVFWVLMTSAGFTYMLATKKTRNLAYRTAAGLAGATAFILVWMNGAVGIIGSENNPANVMYGGVVAVGLIGAGIARFEPHGMVRALFATAIAQFLVPVIALIMWKHDFAPGVLKVLGLNSVFAVLFIGSALLFRHAARTNEDAHRAL
jgi:hypothetical protein